MNPKLSLAILTGTVVLMAAAYLAFLLYALTQMKGARAEGMAKIDTILDNLKNEPKPASD